MSEIPTMREEIDRKALETIEKLQSDLKLGRITHAQYNYGIDILWSAIAGLASGDFLHIMEMMGGTGKFKEREKEIFIRWGVDHQFEESMAVVNHNLEGTVSLSINKKDSTVTKDYDLTGEANPSYAGKKKFDELCKNLLANGFQRVMVTIA